MDDSSPDIAVVGGGPAGLAAAIACRVQGLRVTVLERETFPVDKACGEGLLPPALRALETLGVLPHLDRSVCSPIASLRYVQEDGSIAEVQLPKSGGLAVRRLELSRALEARAREVGVVLQPRTSVRAHRREADAIVVETDKGELRAKLLVAADGLSSPRRLAEGLDDSRPTSRPRFGIRRHFRLSGAVTCVEIHVQPGVEAYLTPVGPDRLGVAFLWESSALGPRTSFESLLALFPALSARLSGVPADSSVRGAGPLQRLARSRVSDRFVLLGDAAGYLDAISGEGLSLAFAAALDLAALAPAALAGCADARSLAPYDRAYGRRYAHYARVTGAMLAMARQPRLRRSALRFLGSRPTLFAKLVAWGIGS
jgi:flavin-dependent dehydrogenase